MRVRAATGRASGIARRAFVLLALGVAVWALWGDLPDVLSTIRHIGWWSTVAATASFTVGLLLTAEVWRRCLRALGCSVRPPVAREIFCSAQVGKYLPGSVWPLIMQAQLARKHGVPGSKAVVASTMFMAAHGVTAVILFAGLLPLAVSNLGGQLWLSALVALPSLLLLHPRVLTLVLRMIPTRGDKGETPQITARTLLVPLAWMVPAWLFQGLAGALLALPLSEDPAHLTAAMLGAFPLAWLAGVAVIVAPAGIGAREAVLVLIAAPFLGAASATSVAVLLRICATAADAGLALRYGVTRPRPHADNAEALPTVSADPAAYRPASAAAAGRGAPRRG